MNPTPTSHRASTGSKLHPHERALERRLDAIRDLVVTGHPWRAHEELRVTLPAIESLPSTRRAHELKARAKMERARLGWYAAGVGTAARLPRALELAFEAQRELGSIPPATLRGDLGALIAGIACDIGDGESLARARSTIEESLSPLMRERATEVAATLLVAQAGVELRMGHLASVHARLDVSVGLLGARVEDVAIDPFAALHIASVRHMFGRLPLHRGTAQAADANADAVDGAGDSAIVCALRNCRLAEATFAEHGRRRDLARVLETSARLEGLRGRVREAHFLFDRALTIADDISDLIGLARITGGIAELLTAGEATDDAVAMLIASITLNRAKGSRMGLACDETLLVRIEETVSTKDEVDPTLDLHLAEARAELLAAITAMES